MDGATTAGQSESSRYPPEGNLYSFNCRSVRFGTMRMYPSQQFGCHFTTLGLCFYVKREPSEVKEKTLFDQLDRRVAEKFGGQRQSIYARPSIRVSMPETFNVHIKWQHVYSIQYSLNSYMSVLFLIVSPQASVRLRAAFGISEDAAKYDRNKPFFDSNSDELYHKYITVVLNDPRVSEIVAIRKFLHDFFLSENGLHISSEEMEQKEANQLLTQTLTPITFYNVFNTPKPGVRSNSNAIRLDPDAAIHSVQEEPTRKRQFETTASTPGTTIFASTSANGLILRSSVDSLPIKRPLVQLSSAQPCQSPQIIFFQPVPVYQPVSRLSSETTKPKPTPKPLPDPEPKVVLRYQPTSAATQITIHETDLLCLKDGEFLNDIIINFYLEHLLHHLPADQLQRIHVFPTYFWTKYTQTKSAGTQTSASKMLSLQDIAHSRVSRWTKRVDLFEKDFILIPINEAAHWFLAIVCYPYLTKPVYADEAVEGNGVLNDQPDKGSDSDAFVNQMLTAFCDAADQEGIDPVDPVNPLSTRDHNEEYSVYHEKYHATTFEPPVITKKLRRKVLKEPCIILLDSLIETNGPSYKTSKLIRDYLTSEWASKKAGQELRNFHGVAMRGVYPKVPQQTNWSDCGVFFLEYVERFLFNGSLSTNNADNDGQRSVLIGDEFFNSLYAQSKKESISTWFPVDRINTKRQELNDLLTQLIGEWQPQPQPNPDEMHPRTDDIEVIHEPNCYGKSRYF